MSKNGCQKYSAWIPLGPILCLWGLKMSSGLLKCFVLFWFWIFCLPNILQKVLEHFSHSSSHLILAQILASFDCLRFPWCKFSCKLSNIDLNSGLKFSCIVLSLYLRQEILIFSSKVLFLEIGWFKFQENIVVLVTHLKFFWPGFCIFQLVTCGGEVIFHILSWKSNFVHVRRK